MRTITLTEEQVKDICEYFDREPECIEDYEVGEMVDEIIDRFVFS